MPTGCCSGNCSAGLLRYKLEAQASGWIRTVDWNSTRLRFELVFGPDGRGRKARLNEKHGKDAVHVEPDVVDGVDRGDRQATAVTNRRILLIDDVITTGATVESAAKALISAGARSVDVLALAKVVRAD